MAGSKEKLDAVLDRAFAADEAFAARGGKFFEGGDTPKAVAENFYKTHIEDYARKGGPSVINLSLRNAEKLGLQADSPVYNLVLKNAVAAEIDRKNVAGNPYHNVEHYSHVSDNATYLLTKTEELTQKGDPRVHPMSADEKGITVAESIAHDILHPGKGNNPAIDPFGNEKNSQALFQRLADETGVNPALLKHSKATFMATSPDGGTAFIHDVGMMYKNGETVDPAALREKYPDIPDELIDMAQDPAAVHKTLHITTADVAASGYMNIDTTHVIEKRVGPELGFNAQGTGPRTFFLQSIAQESPLPAADDLNANRAKLLKNALADNEAGKRLTAGMSEAGHANPATGAPYSDPQQPDGGDSPQNSSPPPEQPTDTQTNTAPQNGDAPKADLQQQNTPDTADIAAAVQQPPENGTSTEPKAPEGDIKTTLPAAPDAPQTPGFWQNATDKLGDWGKRGGVIGGAVLGTLAAGSSYMATKDALEAGKTFYETAVPYGEAQIKVANGDIKAAAHSATVETASIWGAAALAAGTAGALALTTVVAPVVAVGVGLGALAGGAGAAVITDTVLEKGEEALASTMTAVNDPAATLPAPANTGQALRTAFKKTETLVPSSPLEKAVKEALDTPHASRSEPEKLSRSLVRHPEGEEPRTLGSRKSGDLEKAWSEGKGAQTPESAPPAQENTLREARNIAPGYPPQSG